MFLFFTLSVFIVHQMHLCDFCSNFHRNLLFFRFVINVYHDLVGFEITVISKVLDVIFSSFSGAEILCKDNHIIFNSKYFQVNDVYWQVLMYMYRYIVSNTQDGKVILLQPQTSCMKSAMMQHTHKDLHTFSKDEYKCRQNTK